MLAGVWKAGVSNEFIAPGEEIGKENVTFVYGKCWIYLSRYCKKSKFGV